MAAKTKKEKEAVKNTGIKRILCGRWTKAVLAILCVASFVMTTVGLCFTMADVTKKYGNAEGILSSKSYQDGAALQADARDKVEDLMYLLTQFKDESYVRSGKFLTEDQINELNRKLYFELISNQDIYNKICKELNITNVDDESTQDILNDYDGNEAVRRAFRKVCATELNEMMAQQIQNGLNVFNRTREKIGAIAGVLYYVSDGTHEISNLKRQVTSGSQEAVSDTVDSEQLSNQFLSLPVYWSYVNGKYSSYPKPNESQERMNGMIRDQIEQGYVNGQRTIYLGFDQNYLNERSLRFDQAHHEIILWFWIIASSVLLFLITLIYLILAAGHKPSDNDIHLRRFDRSFTEFRIAVFLAAGALALVCVFVGLGSITYGYYVAPTYDVFSSSFYMSYYSFEEFFVSTALYIGAETLCTAIALATLLSVVRGAKTDTLLQNSFLVQLFLLLIRSGKDIYYGGSIIRRMVLTVLVITLLSATFFLWPLVVVAGIILSVQWSKKYIEVKKGVQEVKAGNLSYKIELSGKGELVELARDINAISEGFDLAVQNELRNQRLKTELISNVSHDIKTPLTSIITYVDLLKKEGLDSPNALQYVDVLERKSARLKKLTEDLFAAAKASSGDLPVHMEKVELLSLINQGLVEFGDRIEDSGLEFLINATKEKYYVSADSQLLWRVVENLLGNVLKYAQEQTRVYIDLREEPEKGLRKCSILEIKNISKAKLNIPAEDLMERFKRGDESRTTEGSGLGLAIAKDLITIQHGWFHLIIDGDLFKAVVGLETYPESLKEAPSSDNSQAISPEIGEGTSIVAGDEQREESIIGTKTQ